MKKYKLIGLTGTTGSGKSMVSRIFADKGYAVINADSIARKAVDNPLVLTLLCDCFGEDIVKDGVLDRKLLGQRAFETKEKTTKLNSITHPFITVLFINQVENLAKQGVSNIVFDAPQLFESKLDIICDSIVSVIADEKIRVKRIMERDGISEETAFKRISVQYSSDFFIKNSDYIITNNSTIEKLREQTDKIINLL